MRAKLTSPSIALLLIEPWSITPVSATLVFITSQKLAKGFEKEVLLINQAPK
jgi:hypothetical protein